MLEWQLRKKKFLLCHLPTRTWLGLFGLRFKPWRRQLQASHHSMIEWHDHDEIMLHGVQRGQGLYVMLSWCFVLKCSVSHMSCMFNGQNDVPRPVFYSDWYMSQVIILNLYIYIYNLFSFCAGVVLPAPSNVPDVHMHVAGSGSQLSHSHSQTFTWSSDPCEVHTIDHLFWEPFEKQVGCGVVHVVFVSWWHIKKCCQPSSSWFMCLVLSATAAEASGEPLHAFGCVAP